MFLTKRSINGVIKEDLGHAEIEGYPEISSTILTIPKSFIPVVSLDF